MKGVTLNCEKDSDCTVLSTEKGNTTTQVYTGIHIGHCCSPRACASRSLFLLICSGFIGVRPVGQDYVRLYVYRKHTILCWNYFRKWLFLFFPKDVRLQFMSGNRPEALAAFIYPKIDTIHLQTIFQTLLSSGSLSEYIAENNYVRINVMNVKLWGWWTVLNGLMNKDLAIWNNGQQFLPKMVVVN